MAKMGRRTIFAETRGQQRDPKNNIHGVVTRTGATQFEQHRMRLATLAKWPIENVSDADTIDYISRGHEASAAYIARRFKA